MRLPARHSCEALAMTALGLCACTGAIADEGYPHEDEPIGSVRQVYDGQLYPDIQVNTFRNIDRLFPTRSVSPGAKPYPLPVGKDTLENFHFVSRNKQYDLYDFLSLNRVSGMFSIALWDTESRVLFCARDPFGINQRRGDAIEA